MGVVRQSAALKCGRAFTQRWVHLHNCTTPIKAVDYKDGYLCTGRLNLLPFYNSSLSHGTNTNDSLVASAKLIEIR